MHGGVWASKKIVDPDIAAVVDPNGMYGDAENGYSGDLVQHVDMKTFTDDWGHESEGSSNEFHHATMPAVLKDEKTNEICKKYPKLTWCQKFMKTYGYSPH